MLNDLEILADARSIEDVWAHLVKYMDGYGFDRLIYGFTRFRTAHSYGDPKDVLILSNFGDAYLTGFIDDGLYFDAPMVQWAAENVGASSWQVMIDKAMGGEMPPEALRVLEFNRAHNVTAGYSIGFRDASARAKGAMGLAARAGITQAQVDATWAEHGREIFVVANMAHLKLMCLPYSGTRRMLTNRQREVLEWVGDGKTTQDIATIMDLTPATVEKHLRLARESLDVETTAQAVLKASFQNQIFLLET
jgi:LuxR family transcriptional regulator